jgi:two-component system chemotaxis sensor kinase CheA
MIGDLVMVRAKFDLLLQNSKTKIDPQIFRSLSEINSNFERKIRNLREGIMRTRLVSIGDIFDRMKFVVYDLVRSSQKSIDLEISGSETEIDKFVVEKMFDPLLHIVRNSVSHGIETSEERIKLGKNPVGKLKISAFASGDSVVIEISDDGKGIDKAKVAQKALETGIIKVVSDLPNTDILNIICSPGFSTKDEADMGSGRGVGMTSVKRVVDELGGRIELWTELNKGTKFTIYLPLTLAIADAMIVEVGDQLFAVPQPNIFEIYNVKKEDIRYTEGFEFVEWRNQVLPLIFLNKFFNLKSSNNFLHSYHIIIVETTVGIAGIVVDRVKTKREIVVRALSDPLVRTEGISGATELGDGRAVLILDTTGIVNSHQRKKKQKEVSL